jgi:hypothetical protein
VNAHGRVQVRFSHSKLHRCGKALHDLASIDTAIVHAYNGFELVFGANYLEITFQLGFRSVARSRYRRFKIGFEKKKLRRLRRSISNGFLILW